MQRQAINIDCWCHNGFAARILLKSSDLVSDQAWWGPASPKALLDLPIVHRPPRTAGRSCIEADVSRDKHAVSSK